MHNPVIQVNHTFKIITNQDFTNEYNWTFQPDLGETRSDVLDKVECLQLAERSKQLFHLIVGINLFQCLFCFCYSTTAVLRVILMYAYSPALRWDSWGVHQRRPSAESPEQQCWQLLGRQRTHPCHLLQGLAEQEQNSANKHEREYWIHKCDRINRLFTW